MSNFAYRTNYCLILLLGFALSAATALAQTAKINCWHGLQRRPNPISSLCSRTISAMVSWASMAAVYFVAPQLRASINLPAKACAY